MQLSWLVTTCVVRHAHVGSGGAVGTDVVGAIVYVPGVVKV